MPKQGVWFWRYGQENFTFSPLLQVLRSGGHHFWCPKVSESPAASASANSEQPTLQQLTSYGQPPWLVDEESQSLQLKHYLHWTRSQNAAPASWPVGTLQKVLLCIHSFRHLKSVKMNYCYVISTEMLKGWGKKLRIHIGQIKLVGLWVRAVDE